MRLSAKGACAESGHASMRYSVRTPTRPDPQLWAQGISMAMKNVEDVYRLSSMQEMMLLHTLANTDRDVLFNQFCYEICGTLDVSAFRLAWQQIVARHPVLRTAFIWANLKQPVQVVRRNVNLPFSVLDWQDLSADEQQEKLRLFRQNDRGIAFDPGTAPLMRVAVIRLTSEQYIFIWSCHHLLLDRWCLSTLFEDLFSLYESNRKLTPARLSEAVPFRNYIAWIQKQDPAEADELWRHALQGFTTTTLMT